MGGEMLWKLANSIRMPALRKFPQYYCRVKFAAALQLLHHLSKFSDPRWCVVQVIGVFIQQCAADYEESPADTEAFSRLLLSTIFIFLAFADFRHIL